MGKTSASSRVRLATAAAISGLVLFGAPGVAAAAADAPVTGVPGSLPGNGYPLVDDKGHTIDAGVITLTIGRKTAEAYCVDIKHPLKEADTYQETAWKTAASGDLTVDALAKVQWILLHSTPQVAAEDVLKAANITAPPRIDHKGLDLLVYAATQAAIWHNSDGFVLGDHAGATYAVVHGVYDYLVGQARSESEPGPTLRIAPQTATGAVGSKVGPYTVTSSGPATLKATGGKIVDQHGAEITGPLADGTKFWLTSAAAGKVTVDATGTGTVPTGRVFTDVKKADKYQKIILAGSAPAQATAQAVGTFGTAAPGPSASSAPTLPITGASVTGAVVMAGVLLAVGTGLVLMIRRRRVKFTA